METLSQLFEQGLEDIYYAENQIVKALPKMAEKATSEELAEAFKTHLEETKGQVQRLEQVFEILGTQAKGKKCPAMDGILQEGEEIMKEAKSDTVCDAGLVAAAQAVEHYEKARYTALVGWAETLGLDEARDLLQETLDQETETAEKLEEMAGGINEDAAETDDEDAGEQDNSEYGDDSRRRRA